MYKYILEIEDSQVSSFLNEMFSRPCGHSALSKFQSTLVVAVVSFKVLLVPMGQVSLCLNYSTTSIRQGRKYKILLGVLFYCPLDGTEYLVVACSLEKCVWRGT